MRNILLTLSALLILSCNPCKRLAKDKYKPCFNAFSDTLSIHDTLTLHDTIIVPEIRKEWLIKSDTIINTERVYYSRKGDTTIIICKGDTIYRTKEVIRELKVPYIKYVYKKGIEWGWVFLLGFIALIIWAIYGRKEN
jgi:hypothetical protein